jgi:2,4-dienoyl-CoA reductase-like NADH-dependent reductase (Old Yellow Enzyme family)
MTTSALFIPLNIGPVTLKHRVVMAPLTRSRSEQPGDIPGDLMREKLDQVTTSAYSFGKDREDMSKRFPCVSKTKA